MFKLGVLGKDIGYSLSPKIHLAFAKQLNHPIEYLIYDVDKDPISFIRNFFSEGGFGLNITKPYYQAHQKQLLLLMDYFQMKSFYLSFFENYNYLVSFLII